MGKNREIQSKINNNGQKQKYNYPKLNMQTLILNVPKEDKIDKTDQKWPKMAKKSNQV